MVLLRSSFVTEDTICGILTTRGLNNLIIIHQCTGRRAAGTTVRSLVENLEAVFLRRRIYGPAEYYIRCIIALGDPPVLFPQSFEYDSLSPSVLSNSSSESSLYQWWKYTTLRHLLILSYSAVIVVFWRNVYQYIMSCRWTRSAYRIFSSAHGDISPFDRTSMSPNGLCALYTVIGNYISVNKNDVTSNFSGLRPASFDIQWEIIISIPCPIARLIMKMLWNQRCFFISEICRMI